MEDTAIPPDAARIPQNPSADSGPILFFDGECNFCNRAVNFVLDHDRSRSIRFMALQDARADKLLSPYGIQPSALESMVFLKAGKAYQHSTAAARLYRQMGGMWKPVGLLLQLVPKPLRDWGYKGFARNRYRWFGKADTCRMPTPEIRARFL